MASNYRLDLQRMAIRKSTSPGRRAFRIGQPLGILLLLRVPLPHLQPLGVQSIQKGNPELQRWAPTST